MSKETAAYPGLAAVVAALIFSPFASRWIIATVFLIALIVSVAAYWKSDDHDS